MPFTPDPEALWRQLLAELNTTRSKTVLFFCGSAMLLVLYPDETIRAAVGGVVLWAMTRGTGPPR